MGRTYLIPETSFHQPGNYWRMGETADALAEAGAIEPLIIVGIYNAGVKRVDEYTPVEDNRLGGGQADAYGRMLVEELKPFIDAHYRTCWGEHCWNGRLLKLGGLVSLYLGLRYPTVFCRLAVVSPSVWWQQSGDPEDGCGTTRRKACSAHLAGHRHRSRINAPCLMRCVRCAMRWSSKELASSAAMTLAYFEAEGAAHTESALGRTRRPDVAVLASGPAIA